jgi:hypothetical protein
LQGNDANYDIVMNNIEKLNDAKFIIIGNAISKGFSFDDEKDKHIKISDAYGDRKIEEIAVNGFQNLTTLESIEFSTSITTIGDYAFAGCSNLKQIVCQKDGTNITLHEEIKTIGTMAFANCTAFKEINLKTKSLKSLGLRIFDGWNSEKQKVFVPVKKESLDSNITDQLAVYENTLLIYGANSQYK